MLFSPYAVPTKCVFIVADPACCDKQNVVAEPVIPVLGMLFEKPERGAYDASLLPVIDGLFQAVSGHPFPVLDLAEDEGATVLSYNIDLT